MEFDFTINIANLVMGGGLIWQGARFVEQMRGFRKEFDEHVAEDVKRFDRLELRVDGLHDLARSRR